MKNNYKKLLEVKSNNMKKYNSDYLKLADVKYDKYIKPNPNYYDSVSDVSYINYVETQKQMTRELINKRIESSNLINSNLNEDKINTFNDTEFDHFQGIDINEISYNYPDYNTSKDYPLLENIFDEDLETLDRVEIEEPIKLSIIIPTYNRARCLHTCLGSIPWRDDIEVIIVNDASTDATLSIISQFTNFKIKIVINEQNLGPGPSRDRGLEIAEGKYFTFLDSDDWLYTLNVDDLIDNYLCYDLDFIWCLNRRNDGGHELKVAGTNFQGAVVKRSLVGNIKHPSIRYGEDRKFSQDVIKNNPKSTKYVYKKPIYFYNLNPSDPSSMTYQYNVFERIKKRKELAKLRMQNKKIFNYE